MPLLLPKGKIRTALLGKLKEIFRTSRSQPVGGLIDKINPILRGWVKYFAIGHSRVRDIKVGNSPKPTSAAGISARIPRVLEPRGGSRSPLGWLEIWQGRLKYHVRSDSAALLVI